MELEGYLLEEASHLLVLSDEGDHRDSQREGLVSSTSKGESMLVSERCEQSC